MASVNGNRSTRENRDSRRRRNVPPQGNIRIVDAQGAASTWTIEFDRVVTLVGVPAIVSDVAGTAVSASQTSPTVIEVVMSAVVAGATYVEFPPNDPAVRSQTGGYVAPGQFQAAGA